MKEKSSKTIGDVASELSDLEEPIRNARHFAEALRMIGTSDGLRGETGGAIEMLAYSLILILRDLQDKREFIHDVAFELKGSAT